MARRRTTLYVLILALLFGAGFSARLVIRTRRAAEAFLKRTERLAVGVTTYKEANEILEPYAKYLSRSGECTTNHCILLFGFKNSFLSSLHLAPATEFGGSLVFENGFLWERITYLCQGTCCVDHIIEGKILVAPADPSSPDFSLVLQRGEDGFPWKGGVMLTPKATVQQRHDAYSFNLNCLSKLGGCKTAEELLPAIWKQYGSGGPSFALSSPHTKPENFPLFLRPTGSDERSARARNRQ